MGKMERGQRHEWLGGQVDTTRLEMVGGVLAAVYGGAEGGRGEREGSQPGDGRGRARSPEVVEPLSSVVVERHPHPPTVWTRLRSGRIWARLLGSSSGRRRGREAVVGGEEREGEIGREREREVARVHHARRERARRREAEARAREVTRALCKL